MTEDPKDMKSESEIIISQLREDLDKKRHDKKATEARASVAKLEADLKRAVGDKTKGADKEQILSELQQKISEDGLTKNKQGKHGSKKAEVVDEASDIINQLNEEPDKNQGRHSRKDDESTETSGAGDMGKSIVKYNKAYPSKSLSDLDQMTKDVHTQFASDEEGKDDKSPSIAGEGGEKWYQKANRKAKEGDRPKEDAATLGMDGLGDDLGSDVGDDTDLGDDLGGFGDDLDPGKLSGDLMDDSDDTFDIELKEEPPKKKKEDKP